MHAIKLMFLVKPYVAFAYSIRLILSWKGREKHHVQLYNYFAFINHKDQQYIMKAYRCSDVFIPVISSSLSRDTISLA